MALPVIALMTADACLLGIYTSITDAKESIRLHHASDPSAVVSCEYSGECQFVNVASADKAKSRSYMILEMPIWETPRDVW